MTIRLLQYYRSTTWRTHPARVEAFARAGGRCQGCNTTERLEAHHRYYPSVLGTETADALTILCRSCHRAITNQLRQARYRRRLHIVPDTIRQRPGGLPLAQPMPLRRVTLAPEDTHRQRPDTTSLPQKERQDVSRLALQDSRRRTPPHA